jgi:cellulose synthase (UDP-forming)
MQIIKPGSECRQRHSKLGKVEIFQKQKATWVILGVLGFLCAIAISWLSGNSTVSEFFAQWHVLQENPPVWIEVPTVSNRYYLLAPTAVLFLIAQILIKASPQPKTWSRRIVLAILLFLTIRYIVWRSLSTLNLANPIDGIFSLALFLMEVLVISNSIIELFLMFSFKDRRREADRYSQAVTDETYHPSVDILIPTYNEPDFILKRTIIGAQALDYQNKTIYLLDDTKRSEIKALAEQLNCHYLTRQDNSNAKAGNLNNALVQTSGELVVIFDADFVPTKNFLTRTVGFFQNTKVGLLQTPQTFYNSDPIARNLGLEAVLPAEEEVFYRQIQPMKDGAGSVVCAGTSFVVRRKALKEIGYFVTDSLSEDYFTGIRISAQGYDVIYLDEKLSAGLAAESISAHIKQRIRWARGTLQAFFIESNPLTIPGLNFKQRLAHLEGLLHWFTSIPRLFFLLIPIVYSFFGIEAIKVNMSEIVYLFLPYYILQLTVFSWLNLRSRSAILSDVYSLVQCFPLAITIIKAMLNPFQKGFKVTPKGTSRKQSHFNLELALPLFIAFVVTLICFWLNLFVIKNPDNQNINLGLVWSGYNLVVIGASLLTTIDVPKLSFYEWFPLRKNIKIDVGNQTYWGVTTMFSEEGMDVEISEDIDLPGKLTLETDEENLKLAGKIVSVKVGDGFALRRSVIGGNPHSRASLRFRTSPTVDRIKTVRIMFANLTLTQQKQLIEMLYCQPGQWKGNKTPGELQSIGILFKILLRPLIFNATKLLKA